MKKRLISMALVLVMVLTMLPLQAMAVAFDDVTGHWAEGSISRLSDKGVVRGTLGSFRPDDNIIRGEVATIFSNLMKYRVEAKNTFSDLSVTGWYTKDMLKASAAGIFAGDGDGTIRPEADITRQEFFVTLARLLAMDGSKVVNSFSDRSEISGWALPQINALAAAGFLKGTANPDGTYRVEPNRSITRGEAITMLDRAFPNIYNTAGTYAESVTGNAVISTPKVVLSKMTVGGNLYIAPGVGDGEATLDAVTVPGNTMVYGGGENSLLIGAGSVLNGLTASKNAGTEPLAIKISDKATVKNITVTEGSAKTIIIVNKGTVVEKITVDNDNTEIRGEGTVKEIFVTANNAVISTPNAKVTVAPGVTGTTVGGKAVEGGKTVTTDGTGKGLTPEGPIGGGGIGGGGGGTPVPPSPDVPVQPEGTWAVTYNTNGGKEIKPSYVAKDTKLTDVPQAEKADEIFLGWFTNENVQVGSEFYAEKPITADTTLYAKYGNLKKNQTPKVDSFALSDQEPNVTFTIKAPGFNAEQVKNAIIVTNVGTGGTPELVVVADAATQGFTVSAKDGFRPGAAITLKLQDGLWFNGMTKDIRNASFTIKKAEINEIEFNESLKEVKIDPAVITSPIVEPIAAIDNDATPDVDESRGTLTVVGDKLGETKLEVGAMITLYDNVAPDMRNDPNKDYTDDRVIYAKIVTVDSDPTTDGNQVVFETPSTKEVIALPESLPLDASDFVEGSYDGATDISFSILNTTLAEYWRDYDHIGLSADTTINVGDTIVIMGAATKDADVTAENVVYGTVGTVTPGETNTEVTFVLTSADAIMSKTNDYYSKQDTNYAAMEEAAIKAGLPEQIEKQARESGFVDEAMGLLAQTATQTEGFQEMAEKVNGGPIIDLPSFGDNWHPNIEIPSILIKGWRIRANITKQTEHFQDGGLMCQLYVQGTIEVPLSTDPFPEKLTIDLTATFQQELKIIVNVDGGIEWSWAAFIPYPSDFYMNANVDVFNHTAIKIHAVVKTVGGGIDLGEAGENLKGLKDLDISSEIQDIIGLETAEQGPKTQNLFDMYADMLKNETDYVTLVEQQIFDINMPILGLLKVGIKADFIIKANVNLVLGSSLSYTSGNRYNFWFKLFSGENGTAQTQLIDEEMKFQFYVMGMIGVRIGVNLEVYVAFVLPKDLKGGTFEVAATGVAIETGAYVELYGYFVYTIESLNKVTKSEMSGALYVDFGIYLEISFFARVADGIAAYQPMLYDNKWQLLEAGDRINVYDFSYPEIAADETYVIKNYTTDYMPDSFWSMAGMDLVEGNLVNLVYAKNKFAYTLSNPAFKFDPKTGLVTVTVPENIRIMKCDMTITWTGAKLAFSTTELRRTVHLVWTNLSDEEMSLRHNISVVADGKVVWSKIVSEGEEYTLPTKDELKKLLDFGKFMYKTTNADPGEDLKYSGGTLDYTNQDGEKKLLTADRDLIYTVDVTPRTYDLVIKDVQNADGTTRDLTLTAKFGEAFDLTELKASGAHKADAVYENAKYTAYAKTDCKATVAGAAEEPPAGELPAPAPVGGKPIDEIIDSVFAKQLRANTYTYTAQYNDDFVTATYKFVDSRGKQLLKPVKVKVEMNTYPTYDYYAAVVAIKTKNYMPKRFDKEIDRLTADETYAVTCVLRLGETTDVTFDTHSGDEVTVAKLLRHVGGHLTLPMPVRPGYTFGGWFKDAELKEAFTETNMPNVPNPDVTAETKAVADAQTDYDAKDAALTLATTAFNTATTDKGTADEDVATAQKAVTTAQEAVTAGGGESASTELKNALIAAENTLKTKTEAQTLAGTALATATTNKTNADSARTGAGFTLAAKKAALTEASKKALRLHAMWTANTYNVHFDTNAAGSSVSNSPEDETVVFGTAYALPTAEQLRRSNFKLVGWSTTKQEPLQPDDTLGAMASTCVTARDHTLYAVWQLKLRIANDYFDKTVNAPVVYDKAAHPFTYKVKGTVNDDYPTDGFIVQYKAKDYPPNRWIEGVALDPTKPISATNPNGVTDADKWDVMLYRPENENYQLFKQVIIDGVVITPATRKPENVHITYPTSVMPGDGDTVILEPAIVTGDDVNNGVVLYQIAKVNPQKPRDQDKRPPSIETISELSSSLTVKLTDGLDGRVSTHPNWEPDGRTTTKLHVYVTLAESRNYKAYKEERHCDAQGNFAENGRFQAQMAGVIDRRNFDTKGYDSGTKMQMHLETKTGNDSNNQTGNGVYLNLQDFKGNGVTYGHEGMGEGLNTGFGKDTPYTFDKEFTEDPWNLNGVLALRIDGTDAWRYVELRSKLTIPGLPAIECDHSKVKPGETKAQVPVTLDSNGTNTHRFAPAEMFKRKITATGSFASWGGEYKLDETSAGTITYAYDGMITDQYGTYNAYAHYDAPTMYTPYLDENGKQISRKVNLPIIGNMEIPIPHPYLDLVSYSNNGVAIDEAALYARMTEREETSVRFSFVLGVPSGTCSNADDPMFVKTVIVTRDAIPAK